MSATYLDLPLAVGSSSEDDFELPEPGPYIIEFQGIVGKREFDSKDKDGNLRRDKDGNVLKDVSLNVQLSIVDDDDWEDFEFRDFIPSYISTGNKSGRFWAALLGTTPDKLPTPLPRAAEFAGKRAQANLTHRQGGNGKTYLKIDSIVPMKKRKPARQVVEDDEEPGF